MPGNWWETRLTILCVVAALATLAWLPASLALMGLWMGTLDDHLIAAAWGLTAFTTLAGLLALAVGVGGRVFPRGERCARCGYDVAATLQASGEGFQVGRLSEPPVERPHADAKSPASLSPYPSPRGRGAPTRRRPVAIPPVCPECGSDLSHKGAIATKRWTPRWKLAAAGLLALVVGGAPPGLVRAWPSVGNQLARALQPNSFWRERAAHPIGRQRRLQIHITIHTLRESPTLP